MTRFTSIQIREFRRLLLGKTITEFYYDEDKDFYTLIAQIRRAPSAYEARDSACELARIEFRFLNDLSLGELERPHKK